MNLTEKVVVELISRFSKENKGELPTARSGKAFSGDTWEAINQCGAKGTRGLKKGQTLAWFKKKYFGLGDSIPVEYLISEIKSFCDNNNGKYPTLESSENGGPRLSGGESWRSVDKFFKKGRRGLKGVATSLADFINKNFGRRNRSEPLSVEYLISEIKAYFENNGKYPTQHSSENGGPLLSGGETWGSINDALKNGCRGLKGVAKSLADFKKKHGFV